MPRTRRKRANSDEEFAADVVGERTPERLIVGESKMVKHSPESVQDILGPMEFSTPDLAQIVLRRALTTSFVEDDQWLSSSVMNLLLSHIAKDCTDIVCFSEQFSFLKLSFDDLKTLEDILGRRIRDLTAPKCFVWLVNNKNVHWSLLRATFRPIRQLELFDPLGTFSRGKQLSARKVPINVLNFLNSAYPFPDKKDSWLYHSCNAVTSAHQQNAFDCGVACLLYVKKCGQDMVSIMTLIMIVIHFIFCHRPKIRLPQARPNKKLLISDILYKTLSEKRKRSRAQI